jgi:hypothetical protein
MLFLPEKELKRFREQLSAAVASGDLGELRRAVELFPDSGLAWAALGTAAKVTREGVDALWKAVWLNPCTYRNYLALAEILTELDQSDPMAKHLRSLALWKLSFDVEIPEFIGNVFESAAGAEAWNPATYGMMARAQQVVLDEAPEIPAIAGKLRPHRLFTELQRDARDGLKPATLDGLLQHRKDCEPLLRNALREWAFTSFMLDEASAGLVIAILGEISGPDFIDELMELIVWPDETVFWHVQWALWRQGNRHPQEVRDRFRAAATENLEIRCAIAEHLALLKHVKGDADLLVSLLAGFETFAGELDAPTLLSIVVSELAKRGKAELATTLAERYGSKFVDAARAELDTALDGKTVTMLERDRIPQTTLEEVCLHAVLMGDDAFDDDEELDDDELEDPIDLAPPPRPERNDPCWCGSGKKYKKCHLNADEESDRKRAAAPKKGESLHASIVNRVTEAALEWHKPADVRRARGMYFGEVPAEEIDQEDMGGFIEWLIYDFRDKATRRTAVENFLRTRGPKLTPAENELLESLRDARYALYEVERVVPGSGIDVHDVFTGDRMFVHDISSSHALHKWDCILTRTQFYQGRWIFAGNGVNVPRGILDAVSDYIVQESEASKQKPADWVRANSHSLHRIVKEAFGSQLANLRVVNNEGEEVSFGTAEYAVSDEAELIAKLESLEELKAEGPDESGKRRFVWLQPLGTERRLLGSLAIENGILKAEAMSRTRLETLRGLVEFHGGALVAHRGDHYTSVDEIKNRVARGEKGPNPKPPSEEERAAIGEYLAQHYAGWPDEKLPALGGRTARQAVRDPAGRQAVIDLLRMMENAEIRKQDSGLPAYDFNIIRRDLGLPEE